MSKELVSKLYFSRTQECYLKKYSNHTNYISQLADLMSKSNKKKLLTMTEEVKQVNNVFKKYCEKRNITRLKIDDVVEF